MAVEAPGHYVELWRLAGTARKLRHDLLSVWLVIRTLGGTQETIATLPVGGVGGTSNLAEHRVEPIRVGRCSTHSLRARFAAGDVVADARLHDSHPQAITGSDNELVVCETTAKVLTNPLEVCPTLGASATRDPLACAVIDAFEVGGTLAVDTHPPCTLPLRHGILQWLKYV